MSVKDIVAGPDPSEIEQDPLSALPIKFEPRCKVCKSGFRTVIDRLLISGHSYVGIAQQFVNKDPQFQTSVDSLRKSVERHRKAHLNVRDAAIRDIFEQKAREAGILVETAREQIINEEALLQLAVARGTEQLTNPESKIKYQDAIKAAELLRDKKYEEISAQMEVVNRQYNAIVQAVQKTVPKEMWGMIVATAKAIFEGKTVPDIQNIETEEVRELVSAGSETN